MVAEARPMTLLEREPALEMLAAALSEATSGEGRIALVYGEAGIGKTSLVDHFTRERAGTARTLWGACDSLHTPRPLEPVYDIAPQAGPALRERLDVRRAAARHLLRGPGRARPAAGRDRGARGPALGGRGARST